MHICTYVYKFFPVFFEGGACVFSFIRLNFPGIFPFIQKIKVSTFLASMDISLKYLTWFFNAKLCVFKTLLLFLALLIENIQLRMSALFLKLDSMCSRFCVPEAVLTHIFSLSPLTIFLNSGNHVNSHRFPRFPIHILYVKS